MIHKLMIFDNMDHLHDTQRADYSFTTLIHKVAKYSCSTYHRDNDKQMDSTNGRIKDPHAQREREGEGANSKACSRSRTMEVTTLSVGHLQTKTLMRLKI